MMELVKKIGAMYIVNLTLMVFSRSLVHIDSSSMAPANEIHFSGIWSERAHVLENDYMCVIDHVLHA